MERRIIMDKDIFWQIIDEANSQMAGGSSTPGLENDLEQKTDKVLITEDNIVIDRELMIEDDYVNAYVAAWFDVDIRFATETYNTDDYINVYANYYPETEKLEGGYTLIKADGSCGDFTVFELADCEKEVILAKMKEAGLDECIALMNEGPDTNIVMQ